MWLIAVQLCQVFLHRGDFSHLQIKPQRRRRLVWHPQLAQMSPFTYCICDTQNSDSISNTEPTVQQSVPVVSACNPRDSSGSSHCFPPLSLHRFAWKLTYVHLCPGLWGLTERGHVTAPCPAMEPWHNMRLTQAESAAMTNSASRWSEEKGKGACRRQDKEGYRVGTGQQVGNQANTYN